MNGVSELKEPVEEEEDISKGRTGAQCTFLVMAIITIFSSLIGRYGRALQPSVSMSSSTLNS